jgi:hypothetical protein
MRPYVRIFSMYQGPKQITQKVKFYNSLKLLLMYFPLLVDEINTNRDKTLDFALLDYKSGHASSQFHRNVDKHVALPHNLKREDITDLHHITETICFVSQPYKLILSIIQHIFPFPRKNSVEMTHTTPHSSKRNTKFNTTYLPNQSHSSPMMFAVVMAVCVVRTRPKITT